MSETKRTIFCAGCQCDVDARLTYGVEIYPHRKDLGNLPFWKCDTCGNFVGCHHKTSKPTKPLGCIPTPEIKRSRSHIHRVLDPLWKSGRIKRRDLYRQISALLGKEYHTAEIRTVEEARTVYLILQDIDNR